MKVWKWSSNSDCLWELHDEAIASDGTVRVLQTMKRSITAISEPLWAFGTFLLLIGRILFQMLWKVNTNCYNNLPSNSEYQVPILVRSFSSFFSIFFLCAYSKSYPFKVDNAMISVPPWKFPRYKSLTLACAAKGNIQLRGACLRAPGELNAAIHYVYHYYNYWWRK